MKQNFNFFTWNKVKPAKTKEMHETLKNSINVWLEESGLLTIDVVICRRAGTGPDGGGVQVQRLEDERSAGAEQRGAAAAVEPDGPVPQLRPHHDGPHLAPDRRRRGRAQRAALRRRRRREPLRLRQQGGGPGQQTGPLADNFLFTNFSSSR